MTGVTLHFRQLDRLVANAGVMVTLVLVSGVCTHDYTTNGHTERAMHKLTRVWFRQLLAGESPGICSTESDAETPWGGAAGPARGQRVWDDRELHIRIQHRA